MQRNVIQCGHCEKTFLQLTPHTPIINRSDGIRFHVALFAGPEARPRVSGGFYDDQVVCYFAYAHDDLGPKAYTTSVVITHASDDPEDLLRQVEDAADQLAELVKEGRRLTAVYTLAGWHLTPGFPI